ncbi:MAG: phosphonopyruvate decarboxylase [Bacteroidales bacterium]|jgi:phosphonopyruvate decarboxylase|nr:phosphonopyruvate decarboxylase [Bacteroidales bacterium]
MSPKYFIETLRNNNIDFFAGVPDSLLKSICAYIQDNTPAENNIITANEGAAIGLGAGYYLATGKIPVIYMQNSGLGNIVNPLTSLIDKEVYNIPMLLLIGWRGEPGVKDEPQHIKQGRITIPLLDTLEIKNEILTKDDDAFPEQLSRVLSYINLTKEAYALIVQKDTFENYSLREKVKSIDYTMNRENAISIILDNINDNDVVVSTTGMTSRELFEQREKRNQGHDKDFLTVGSMGHASQIALGIAISKKYKKIYCFDGDGAALMHMGSLPVIGSLAPQNYIHILFNNGAHDSVGGQPTVGFTTDFCKIVLSSGYKKAYSVETEDSLKSTLNEIRNLQGPIFIEIKVQKGARKDLGRPTRTPLQNKEALMKFLNE